MSDAATDPDAGSPGPDDFDDEATAHGATDDTFDVSFDVDDDEAGDRLDALLADHSGIPRSRLEIHEVRINGTPARGKDRVAVGVSVDAVVADRAERRPPAVAHVDIDIVYADDDVLVIDKPAGVPVHPPAGEPDRLGTLVNALLARYPELGELAPLTGHERPGIVHRLDADTSGLLVVARSAAAVDGLGAQIAAHSMHREYAAFVAGAFDTAAGRIDAPIGRRPGARYLSVVSGGRPSVTQYAVEAAWERPDLTAVTLVLETGRTHQIRVHCRAIGHPVVGDRPYGGRMLLGAKRQVLHAHKLGFVHPVTDAELAFTSPLPADLRGVLRKAGLPVSGAIPPDWGV